MPRTDSNNELEAMRSRLGSSGSQRDRHQRRRRPTTTAFSTATRLGMAVMALTFSADRSATTTTAVSAFQPLRTHGAGYHRHRRAPLRTVFPAQGAHRQHLHLQRRSVLLAAVDGKDDQEEADDFPPPLFDVDLVADDDPSSSDAAAAADTFEVSEKKQPAFEELPDDDDGAQFYDVALEDEWKTDAKVSTGGDSTMAAAEGVSEVVDDEYARDEDDMLTELEDRMYVDEDGIRKTAERCILVGVDDLSLKRRQAKEARNAGREMLPEETQGYFTLEESMTEMRELIKTAGLELVGEVTQRLQEPNPRTYVGTGKVIETEEALKDHDACTVVFDAELTPGQQKALENSFNKKLLQNDFLGAEKGEIKVIDRTALILDIFAQHAKTREGKLQVDLALHEYRKPRLTKLWTHLERQSGAGGVGLRGPGESQLEIDKRLIRDRIIVLKRKIDDVQKQRDIHRKGRLKAGLPVLALVGYTNAGKSTLLNYLTRAGVMAENILFATLDPTTRKVKLPGYKTHPEVLLTDTVGFIQKLPTQLVAAFRATLEEVREADILIHVVDVSNPMWAKQANAVRTVLNEIGAGDKPMVQLLNKIDLLSAEDAEYCRVEARAMKNAVAVSSVTGEGMGDFVAVTEEALSDLLVPIEMELPYSKGEQLNLIHEVGAVETVEYRETGTYVKGRVPRAIANRLDEYSLVETAYGPSAKKKQKKGQQEDDIDWDAVGRGRHKAKNM